MGPVFLEVSYSCSSKNGTSSHKVNATTREEEQREPIQCFYEPLSTEKYKPGKYLTVSGLSEIEQRLRSLKSMIQALTNPQAFAPTFF